MDRAKGRFRSFLLASLRHFVSNERRDQSIQRRGGGQIHVALDEPGVAERCEAASVGQPAELVFDRVWAETVMGKAARQLRDEYAGARRAALYEVIRAWLAAEAQPGDYARVAPQRGMTEGALSGGGASAAATLPRIGARGGGPHRAIADGRGRRDPSLVPRADRAVIARRISFFYLWK